MRGKKKKMSDAGEFEFIKYLRTMMPQDGGDIIRSVGDDCFAARSFGNDLMISTIDTFVENVHFKRDYATYEQTGRRCMAASVSDIAAMAGIPVYTLVSLSLPADFIFDDAVGLFVGLQNAAQMYGCPVIGGETTSTAGPATITVTVIGRVSPDHIVLRSGAKEGDSIYVSGYIGEAMAGLLAFERDDGEFEELKDAFLFPEALVSLARALTNSYSLTAMIDVSDGVPTDIGNICNESFCGAVLYEEKLPLSDDFLRICEKYDKNAADFALSGGEDFELLFTSDDETMTESFELAGQQITLIGEITAKSEGIRFQRSDGKIDTIVSKGYEHFKNEKE
ncbi:thiamine-phosphate kinase [Candidatus Latescibacterota bacterium]